MWYTYNVYNFAFNLKIHFIRIYYSYYMCYNYNKKTEANKNIKLSLLQKLKSEKINIENAIKFMK